MKQLIRPWPNQEKRLCLLRMTLLTRTFSLYSRLEPILYTRLSINQRTEEAFYFLDLSLLLHLQLE